MPALDCQERRNLLSEYLDGELSDSLRLEFERHLEECPACRSEVESLRDVIRLAGDDRVFPLPRGFSSRLYSRIQQKPREVAPQEIPVGITNENVPVGSHLIHFWQTQSDFERGVRFLYPGLGKDDHCIIFGHQEALAGVQDVLREQGFDPEQLVASGKLTVLKRHANAETTIGEISAAMESALNRGATLIRFLGNLGLGVAPLPGGEADVLDLEAKADALIRGLPAVIVCMYDISTVPGRLMFQGGLQSHDLTVCPTGIRSNPFYDREHNDPQVQ